MRWTAVTLLMIMLTILTIRIPVWVDSILYKWSIGVWAHFPGFIGGITWMTLCVFIMTLLGRGVNVHIPMFQRKDKTDSNKIYSLEDLKAFASKMLRVRLNSKYLHQFDEAKNKDEYVAKLVEEVIKANPPKPK